MNNWINRTMKWALCLVAVAALFGACSKDEDPAWMALDSTSLFVDGLGKTATLGFTSESLQSVTVTDVPKGWTITADLSKKMITVTAPVALADSVVKSGTVIITGHSYESNYLVNKLFVSLSNRVDLSAQPSNCYILSQSHTEYLIDLTKRGELSADAALPVVEAKLVWQTSADLIKYLKYKDGKLAFHVNGDGKGALVEGNALIGAYDAAGNMLWNWHLWVVDAADVKEQTYANGKTFMSLNLGAAGNTNTTNAEILASYGLFYQWGRKEPFVGPATYNVAQAKDRTLYDEAGRKIALTYVASTAEIGTSTYAAAHPLDFILGVEASNYDWMYATHTEAFWGDAKTVNDPCPRGWRLPSKADFAGLTIVDKAVGNDKQFGWMLTDGAVQAYYPAAGFRTYLKGNIQNVYNPVSGVAVPKPWVGYYWTSGVEATRSAAMFFWLDAADVQQSGIEISTPQYRANGMQIRCVKG
ncbi:MAG: FISUMP domain-containing protein [Alistipes sp.]